MPPLAPFLLERIALPKVWGGRNLSQVPGIELPPGVDVGETWELYDRPEGSSRLRGRATTLADLLRDHGDELLGRGVPRAHGGRFPLLLKFLDARDALSVQVHPDDIAAKAENDSGKNECWIVLHAGPNARVVRGFKPGVTREQFLARAGGDDLGELLWAFRPEVGDVIHIPPGTVHAVGPDLVVFEVQQNSDVTYRLHDWGRGREVHVQKAVSVARVESASGARPVVAPTPLPDGGTQLIATADFRVRRYTLRQPLQLAGDGRFCAVTVVGGTGALAWPGGSGAAALVLGPGDTALVPACCPRFDLIPNASMNVLVCDPGVR
ncbi:MAG: type I phosphomannose isomerase catalytic subunit [Planctomycetota bacterium]|jgi:mannose-6-phosphate isomerase